MQPSVTKLPMHLSNWTWTCQKYYTLNLTKTCFNTCGVKIYIMSPA